VIAVPIVLLREKKIMATLQEVIDAVQTSEADTKAAVEAAAARVAGDLATLAQRIQDLLDQLAQGGATPEQLAELQSIGDDLTTVKAEAEAIDPAQ
jgi:hypothetical protein